MMTDAHFLSSEVETKNWAPEIEVREDYDGDEHYLARLGKKQVLRVRNPG